MVGNSLLTSYTIPTCLISLPTTPILIYFPFNTRIVDINKLRSLIIFINMSCPFPSQDRFTNSPAINDFYSRVYLRRKSLRNFGLIELFLDCLGMNFDLNIFGKIWISYGSRKSFFNYYRFDLELFAPNFIKF